MKNLRLIIQPTEHRGYGEGLRLGILNSKYDYIFYTAGDGQFDTSDISLLASYVNDYDIVTGCRVNRQDQFMRIIVAAI